MQNITQKQLVIGGIIVAVVLAVLWLNKGQFSLTKDAGGPMPLTAAEERAAVLTPPLPEHATEYEATVERLAKESSTLTIGANCAMEPLVLRLPENATTTLLNTDTMPHTVEFEGGGIFVLAPNYKKEINLSTAFAKTGGTHRYRCDDISKTENVGVMYVVK